MQRRAVALYLTFFAIVAAGAYGLIVTASVPDERVIGLWGIVELSIVAVIILLATAFLPVKD